MNCIATLTSTAITAALLCSVTRQVQAYGLGTAANIQRTYECLHVAAKKYGHRPELVFGIAAQESSFNPAAVSYIKGKPIAYGVMQVYYDVHKPVLDKLGVARTDLFNPCVGADQGARILREFMQVHGNSWKAVGAYYAGNRFQNEADRRWYAHSVAKRVVWFELHGTASVLRAGFKVNGDGAASVAKLTAPASVATSAPVAASARAPRANTFAATTTVAWEAQ
jgi:soluble lytic murein transglycosylase-like protein